MLPPVRMNLDQMQQAAAQGAYLEFVYNALIGPKKAFEIGEYAAASRAVGPEHCILSSDLGQLHNAPPAEGLREFIQALREEGVADKDLETMTKVTPARLLRLE